ncbi:MAG: hypothetical protein R3B07_27595 [Polyangiaceae bacterium]
MLRTIKHVNKLLNHPVQLWGILPTFFDARARICHEALDTLRERYFRERCSPPVRSAIKVKEAPAQGKTLPVRVRAGIERPVTTCRSSSCLRKRSWCDLRRRWRPRAVSSSLPSALIELLDAEIALPAHE